MIKPERLKELIEKEATIYFYSKDYGIIEESNLKGFEPYNYFDSTDLVYENKQYDLEDLFETKSEAEHYAKYGNIEKTVKMPVLPTWEEIINYKNESDYYSIRWCQNIFEIDKQYLFCVNLKGEFISLRREVDGEINKYLIDEKLTEQSYYKALDKMVELWKEEV